MIHYHTYTSSESDKLVDVWNRSFSPDFPLDLALWRQNVDSCEKTFPDASIVALKDGHIVGAVIGKNPNRISAIFVVPEMRRRGIATELLERAEVAFTGELETTLIVGQDDAHFFPGVPAECLEARAFFEARGYKRSDGYSHDMRRSLVNYNPLVIRQEIVDQLNDLVISIQPCTERMIPSLLRHIEENYSSRWLRDTRNRLNFESDASEIIIAVEKGYDVIGFCHTYTTKSKVIGPSIYWRALLDTRYGGLGPIGVAKNRRQIGLGIVLLNESVSTVAQSGATDMVIDWTALVDFYARAGFSVWKKYISFTKTQ